MGSDRKCKVLFVDTAPATFTPCTIEMVQHYTLTIECVNERAIAFDMVKQNARIEVVYIHSRSVVYKVLCYLAYVTGV